jgi:colicin import membrane protein
MKRLFVVISGLFVMFGACAEEFPSLEERQATDARLQARRNAIDAEYKQALKDCYQKFNVNGCRYDARERRIAADKALRPEELAYKAMERRIHADEARQRLEEKNGEAAQKEAEAKRAQALEERKQRASEAEQKQIDHELKGTRRGEYDERVREAQEHRANVEKRLRERNKAPAAPLPVPGTSR